ncbi:universal stress protein [Oricola nitratireducens]|uniref:universal stress protein n=1 Tax=Oricola nitratireducens TaxID=2775868 RepID=UPI0018692969|nr:universal stress protein [Oricola nitratireducens]
MSFNSILVHMEFDGISNARLQYATDMAGDLDALLIGFAATAVRPVHITEMGVETDDTYREEAVIRNRKRFDDLKAEFFATAGDGPNSAWRQSEDLPTRALTANARAADLVISGTPHGAIPGDIYRAVDPGDLVCDSGRPVLFVAEGAVFRHPHCAVIGWKDTPEARRAVAFALPFLQLSKRILVLSVGEEKNGGAEEGLNDVVRFLMRHGIDADGKFMAGKNGPENFVETVRAEQADLVVTGAYGHSRMRERIFGGFTRTLLMQQDLNRLMIG